MREPGTDEESGRTEGGFRDHKDQGQRQAGTNHVAQGHVKILVL